MVMKVRPGRIVSLVVKITDDEGRVLELALSDAPLEAVAGSGTLRPEIEAALAGQRPGKRAGFRWDPPQPPGDPGLVEVPRSMWPAGVPPRLGVGLWMDDESGPRPAVVREIRSDTLLLDLRDPAQGRARNVMVVLQDVREVSPPDPEDAVE